MEPRRRAKKGQVVPENEGTENNAFAMEVKNGEKENNNLSASDRFAQAVKEIKRNDLDGFKLITNVKASANKWKMYVTSRRVRKRPQHEDKVVASGQDGGKGLERQTSGKGLDDIHEDYTKYSSFKQSGHDGEKKDFEMSVASNRALVQYFAKLGQSSKEDETINLEFVHTLLSSGADINCTDKYGQTVFHEVARAWHIDVAKFLIEHGADINKGDIYGRTPLHVAAAVDYPDMVDLLIRNGANKEAKTEGENQTPIFFAARNDAVQSLKMLLKHGCLFKEEKDFKGRTPIHVAAELDRSETARYLLEMNAPVWIPDNKGTRAITWMINKMPPVANEALNQFHLTDRPNRRQYFYLNFLVRDKEKDPEGNAVSPLQFAVNFKQYDLIMHPTFTRLLDIQWQKFGRFWAVYNLIINLLYIVVWTAIGSVPEYNERHIYVMPDDAWRIVLWLLAGVFTVYQIFEEIREYFRSKKLHSEFEKNRTAEINNDLKYCHPRWPEEENYLRNELNELEKTKPKYFSDSWNIFDWLCYILLMVCIATHLADVISHTDAIARTHVRIMAVTIILLWLRLMKNARAFALLGPFIVMLGHMISDCIRFLFLYMEFYIPFLTAFWMLFGGTKKAENGDEEVTVDGYSSFGRVFFSVFRLTLVDDYDYDNMHKIDSIMSDLLLTAWFFLSAILCLNLFIALLSDTFQRVYDNAQANAVMQKAITITNTWDGISTARRERFLKFIEENCSPLQDDYDDDLTQAGDEDLKKVTIQIKEELDHFQEMFKLHFGDPASQVDHGSYPGGGGGGGGNNGGGGGGYGGTVVSTQRFEAEVSSLKESIKDVKSQQENMAMRLKKDMTSVKSMLRQLIGKEGAGGLAVVEYDAPEPQKDVSDLSTQVRRMKRKGRSTKSDKVPLLEQADSEASIRAVQPILDIDTTESSPGAFVDPTQTIQPRLLESLFSPGLTSLDGDHSMNC